MKILIKHQTIERENSDKCIVTEYPIDDQMLDFAIVKLNGRYPDVKRATNLRCKEIVYVHEGKGSVEVDGHKQELSAGDVVLIESGEKFFWEGCMTLHIACAPAFTVEQHQMVE